MAKAEGGAMKAIVTAAMLGMLAGCASLLPAGKQETVTPWHSFEEAKAAYDRIEPYQTSLADLKALGYDPAKTPNVTILNHSQVIKTAVPQPSFTVEDQPQGIRDCIHADIRCIGYSLDQSQTRRHRVGNFFLDFLNFSRETLITGWRFGALIAIVDGVVVYKQWSGQPLIRQIDTSSNPLGPLQDAGGSRLLPR